MEGKRRGGVSIALPASRAQLGRMHASPMPFLLPSLQKPSYWLPSRYTTVPYPCLREPPSVTTTNRIMRPNQSMTALAAIIHLPLPSNAPAAATTGRITGQMANRPADAHLSRPWNSPSYSSPLAPSASLPFTSTLHQHQQQAVVRRASRHGSAVYPTCTPRFLTPLPSSSNRHRLT